MNFLRKIFASKVLPSWVILIMDVGVSLGAVAIAFMLRYSPAEMEPRGNEVLMAMGLTLFFNLIFFHTFHTYSNVLRFSSFTDVLNISFALISSFFSCIIVTVVSYYGFRFLMVDHGVLTISYVVMFVLMSMVRMTIKALNDSLNEDRVVTYNTFVYGTKIGGINIAKAIRMARPNKFHLKGFVADDPAMKGKVMMGVNVYLNDEKLIERIHENNVEALIVSPLKADKLKETDIADRLLKENVTIYLAPDVTDDWQGIQKANLIRQVQIEDLLGRDPIHINMHKIAEHLEGKRVLITGAAGSIGSEIMRQVAVFNPYELILVDQAETPLHDIRLELHSKWSYLEAPTIVADISNKKRMEEIFDKYRPEYVFHAAAYKHVPMMEDNVSEAIQNNVLGTKVLADLSVKYGVERFVMISTDKAVNPSNVMGCSKRICEIYVQALAKKIQKDGSAPTQFITTRFGNVLGSNGSVIPLFRQQIERGGPVTVTHPDIIRYFMTIPEACQLVLEAGSMGKGGEIFIFDMGKPVKILDLANKMIRLSGRTDVKVEFTGLRHGEKLYEELLATKENTKPTSHDKIMIANVREYDFDDISDDIDALIEASYHFDPMRIVARMKDLVPEFKSLNSPYSILDSGGAVNS
ncbi:MAG: polysaccharide biosynthesis protein [Bacteroidales bacterium]|nr:polysaccharide biosynthesis protein [Bacteroidales bacterium]